MRSCGSKQVRDDRRVTTLAPARLTTRVEIRAYTLSLHDILGKGKATLVVLPGVH